MTDERAGLPSASGAERYALCPGSFMAERGLPDTTSEDAERGNRIHAWLAGEDVTLAGEDSELAERCKTQREKLVDSTFPAHIASSCEVRLWAHGWSGKADFVATSSSPRMALVADYKTGRGEVAASASNLQLRALAVLVSRLRPDVERVRVAIIQPLASPEPLTCDYEREDLERAADEIQALMDRVQDNGQPRIPSPKACQYCKANGTDRCPESRAVVKELVVAGGGKELMSPETLGAFLVACKQAEQTIAKARELARSMLAQGVKIPGWTLKQGRTVETITAPGVVFDRWCREGLNPETFQKAVSITKSALTEALATERPTESNAEMKRTVARLIEGATEAKTTAPSLTMERE